MSRKHSKRPMSRCIAKKQVTQVDMLPPCLGTPAPTCDWKIKIQIPTTTLLHDDYSFKGLGSWAPALTTSLLLDHPYQRALCTKERFGQLGCLPLVGRLQEDSDSAR